jgi:hypothetical protein
MRDRAFERIIVIPKVDNPRFIDILNNIPRADVVRHIRKDDKYFYYIVKVKKEELLAIKLCVGPKSITRVAKTGPRRPMSNLKF